MPEIRIRTLGELATEIGGEPRKLPASKRTPALPGCHLLCRNQASASVFTHGFEGTLALTKFLHKSGAVSLAFPFTLTLARTS
jgi:hypothetical protein